MSHGLAQPACSALLEPVVAPESPPAAAASAPAPARQPVSPSGGGARLASLDLLRGVAIVLVLGRHLWEPAAHAPAMLRPLLTLWHRGGWVGVDLFFVLSGFLVCGLLFRNYQERGRLDLGRFLVRRGLKIYPAFFVMLGITVAWLALLGRAPTWPQVLAEVCFMQSYLPHVWNHTWSLAVEEHFYLLLPLLLWALIRLSRGGENPFRALPWVWAIAAGACLGLRYATASWIPFDFQTHLFPTHLRLDSFLLGAALSYAFWFHGDTLHAALERWRRGLIVAGALCLAPAFVAPIETPWITTWGLTLFSVGSALLLAGMLATPVSQGRLARLLCWIGFHSYSIYLWHMPVRTLILPALGKTLGWSPTYLGAAAVYLLLSVLLGVVFAKLVELPVLAARDRWFPEKKPIVPSCDIE